MGIKQLAWPVVWELYIRSECLMQKYLWWEILIHLWNKHLQGAFEVFSARESMYRRQRLFSDLIEKTSAM